MAYFVHFRFVKTFDHPLGGFEDLLVRTDGQNYSVLMNCME